MILRQYREHDDMGDRYLILCTLVAIIQARKIVFGATTNVDESGKMKSKKKFLNTNMLLNASADFSGY